MAATCNAKNPRKDGAHQVLGGDLAPDYSQPRPTKDHAHQSLRSLRGHDSQPNPSPRDATKRREAERGALRYGSVARGEKFSPSLGCPYLVRGVH